MLIVDDEAHILESLKSTLNWERYGITQIETAANADEAIEKAIKWEPDIAIFDVCIGDIYGYDIIAKLNALHLKTQYILISEHAEFEYAQKAIRCGAKDFLLKPVNREELKAAIEKIILEDLHDTLPDEDRENEEIDPVLNVRYDSLSNLTRKMLLMIKAESNRTLSLKTIADKFKMNSTYLGQLFLKETHIKFSEYLMRYRLQCAKIKIEHSDEKISYIAYSIGFANLNYFYAKFKEYYNLSPTDLREKRLREEAGKAIASPQLAAETEDPQKPRNAGS